MRKFTNKEIEKMNEYDWAVYALMDAKDKGTNPYTPKQQALSRAISLLAPKSNTLKICS